LTNVNSLFIIFHRRIFKMQQDYREPEYKVRPTWGLAWGLLWDMLEQNKRLSSNVVGGGDE